MSSNFQYGILSGFRAVSEWQNVILRNAQGLLLPGFNKTNIHFGGTNGGVNVGGQKGTTSQGSLDQIHLAQDSLKLQGTDINFEQGTIDPAFNPTALAINGDGFFILAENLRPGARLLLSRNGDFHYDGNGRLVNSQGLFVVGGEGRLTDPPLPVTNPGNGEVDLTKLTLARVGQRNNLAVSGYGPLIYQTTLTSGPIEGFASGRPEVGFAQSNSLEIPLRPGAQQELEMETARAQQTYKIFKDMLDTFNKSTDDALGLVR